MHARGCSHEDFEPRVKQRKDRGSQSFLLNLMSEPKEIECNEISL